MPPLRFLIDISLINGGFPEFDRLTSYQPKRDTHGTLDGNGIPVSTPIVR